MAHRNKNIDSDVYNCDAYDDTCDDLRARLDDFYEDNKTYLLYNFDVYNLKKSSIPIDKYTNSKLSINQYIDDYDPSRKSKESKNKKREQFTSSTDTNYNYTILCIIFFIIMYIFYDFFSMDIDYKL